MKKELILLALLGIVLAFSSCEEEEVEEGEAIIYGTVISRSTGKPLYNVLVQETEYGLGSAATGEDGSYEFTVSLKSIVIRRTYRFCARKEGYGYSEYEVELRYDDNGRHVKIDFQL